MTIGIIPNISKKDIVSIVDEISIRLGKHEIDYLICDSILKFKSNLNKSIKKSKFLPLKKLIEQSDMVISIGGDGTMLNTAYEVRNTKTPIIGVNFGKLGFLAEFDLESFNDLLIELKSKEYVIEERMSLVGNLVKNKRKEFYAINDIVIDKGPWPKMIELTVKVDEDYVSTFSADGIIIATPTGSTGYSLSTGGPIVNPKAGVITLSPIAPHTLTMRPLVISDKQKITIIVKSLHNQIQVSCDGQRSYSFDSPAVLTIEKSNHPIRLVHSSKTNYFQTLRNKLYWGLDVRKMNNIEGDK